MNTTTDSLQNVAALLDTLATGGVLDRTALLDAALAMNTYCSNRHPNRDMLDVAAGLEALATGGTLGLDAAGRQRAAKLATILRQVSSSE